MTSTLRIASFSQLELCAHLTELEFRLDLCLDVVDPILGMMEGRGASKLRVRAAFDQLIRRELAVPIGVGESKQRLHGSKACKCTARVRKMFLGIDPRVAIRIQSSEDGPRLLVRLGDLLVRGALELRRRNLLELSHGEHIADDGGSERQMYGR